MTKVTGIQRISKTDWGPAETGRGFQLIDPSVPYPGRNLAANATFVRTLQEAGDLVTNKGYGIRMILRGGKHQNYIYPRDLLVIRT